MAPRKKTETDPEPEPEPQDEPQEETEPTEDTEPSTPPPPAPEFDYDRITAHVDRRISEAVEGLTSALKPAPPEPKPQEKPSDGDRRPSRRERIRRAWFGS